MTAIRTCRAFRWPASRLCRGLLVASALLGLQVILWLTVGIRTLPFYVPGAIYRTEVRGLQEAAARPEIYHPYKEPQVVLLCDRLASVTSARQLDALNQLSPGGKVTFLRENEARGKLDGLSYHQVHHLCFRILWTTPLLAEFETTGNSSANFHRAWFFLGVWVATVPYETWVGL